MIEAALSPMEKNSNWIGKLNRTSKRKNPPVVRSVTVYKICVALNLRAQLCPVTTSNASICDKQQKPKPKKSIPKVHSIFIFHICRALDLEAILASPYSNEINIDNSNKSIQILTICLNQEEHSLTVKIKSITSTEVS
ncbi:hypothetical protein TNCV_1070011 [Trichonephila clavipes]|nr:hypothetical protein TNCV_1070011 [Trichonephila clavipes]